MGTSDYAYVYDHEHEHGPKHNYVAMQKQKKYTTIQK